MTTGKVSPEIGMEDMRIVTMADFTKDAERIVQEVSTSGRSAVLTQGGRFVALVRPAQAVCWDA